MKIFLKSAITIVLIAACCAHATAETVATGIVKNGDGSYRYANELYTAVIGNEGRLRSFQVQGTELLSQADVNPKGTGASFIGGADSRTFLPTPNITLEAGMVVARGGGREVSYRFQPDGIDFLFDVKETCQWAFHLQRQAITHLVRPNAEVVPLREGGPTAGVLVGNGYQLAFTPTFFTFYRWIGSGVGTPDMVSGAYIAVRPGKSEASVRMVKNSGWTQKLDVLEIKGERADHLFPKGKPVKFEVKLRNRSDKEFAGTLNVTVTDHAGIQPSKTFTLPVTTRARGESTVTWQAAFDQPLVSKTLLNLKAAEERVLTKDLVFVYDAEHYQPPLTRPADFQPFWETTLQEMRSRPLDLKVTPAPELGNAHKTVSKVSFTGLGGRLIEGWLVEPTAPGKYPAEFGARVRNYGWPAAKPDETADIVSLTFKLEEDGLYRTGMESRETAEFRRVDADFVRCVDVLVTREKVDSKRIVAFGASRTGPAAFAAAALDHRIALVTIHVPTSAGISWPSNFYGGWGAPSMGGHPAGMPRAEWNTKVLAYFDMVNFAPYVKCPVAIGLGLRDYGLSPAPGIIAAYAYLSGAKALGVSPWEGHCYPKVYQDLVAQYRAQYLKDSRK
jgi:cephalosporin-C deacetylase-like acetyl esterase